MRKHLLLALSLCLSSCAFAQLNGNGYYRVKNKATGNYASLASDEMSYQKAIEGVGGKNLLADMDGGIFGGYTPKSPSENGAVPTVLAKIGCYLQNDIRFVEAASSTTTPATIFYFKNNSGSEYNLLTEGTDLKTITTGSYSATITVNFPGFYTTINSLGNDSYNIYIPVTAKAYSMVTVKMGNYYFADNEGTFGIEKNASTEDKAQWYIEPATTFNVKPLSKVKDGEGHYYTTLCVDFPFSIPSSGSTVVAAYTVTGQDENGCAVLEEISGTIAGGTPVILECTSTDATTNVLNIVIQEPASTSCANGTYISSDGNYLKGRFFNAPSKGYSYLNYLNQVNSPQTATLNTTGNSLKNDRDNYRVLNCVKGVVGFYKLKNASATMGANKAFLYIKDLPTVSATASAKSFGVEAMDEVTGISTLHSDQSQQKVIYDLQGRRVQHPSHGIYIVNGKKVIY
jgi:hypothetical protein